MRAAVELFWSVVWRLILGVIFLGSLVYSALVMLGAAIGGRNSIHLCDSLTPQDVFNAAPSPENVEVGVSISYWPLSIVCNWRGGDVVRSLALDDWSATYWFYGSLLLACVVAFFWITVEIWLSRRRGQAQGR